ncbi:MAG: hypothetical protein QM662_10715 [Gordonia sp. (in: high G+C Gram-positive bacteria)]
MSERDDADRDDSDGDDPEGDNPDRIPTQAELDAEDLAELARRSQDRDEALLYPRPEADPGEPPAELVRQARAVWLGAALAGLICLLYGIVEFGSIGDALADRLRSDAAAAPAGQPSADSIDTYAVVLPVIALVISAVLLIGEGIFLRATWIHHSRNCRNFFLTIVVVHVLCIPVGLDLFYDYPGLWHGAVIVGWGQLGLLVLAGLMSLRRAVDDWLPTSTRLRPTRMLGAR